MRSSDSTSTSQSIDCSNEFGRTICRLMERGLFHKADPPRASGLNPSVGESRRSRWSDT